MYQNEECWKIEGTCRFVALIRGAGIFLVCFFVWFEILNASSESKQQRPPFVPSPEKDSERHCHARNRIFIHGIHLEAIGCSLRKGQAAAKAGRGLQVGDGPTW